MKYSNVLFVFVVVILMGSCVTSRHVSQDVTKTPQKEAPKKNKGPFKPYKEIITEKAETDEGVFDVHKVGDKFYYEIDKEQIGREFLWVTRISGTTPNLSFGGAGMKARGQQVVRWEKRDNKIYLHHVSYNSVADHDTPIYESVVNNNFEPVIHSFKIEALGQDSNSYVINIDGIFTSDVPLFSGLSSRQRTQFKVSRLDKERSFIEKVHSYPKNLELKHVLTYISKNPPEDQQTETISLQMNQSMIGLPEELMPVREYDNRVGYFSIQQYDYSADEHRAARRRYVTRWRLEPKDPSAYARGELVEPVKPIVYYIDPATPHKWRKYIKQGVDDWQKSFEKIGFKNAIYALDPPTKEEDPEFSPEDVRYSVIRYITTPIQNAQGPHVHDPRTGEILESDILWYHNVMNLLRNWFFVQTAASNPDSRLPNIEDKVMGELIRFVSAHEVGHTLGLPHNWGSSYAVTVDQLRDPDYTSTHGTAPSIMDYARFNYVAQPEDGVTQFMPMIGIYDEWSIKWGYSYFGNLSLASQKKKLNDWIVERADDPRYFYGRQTVSRIDPRSQNEDLTNDAITASKLGLANLKVTMKNLETWAGDSDDNYDDISELYVQLVIQWNRYMGHVSRQIGGIYETYKNQTQDGPIYEYVDPAYQRKAVEFLNQHAFTKPSWMLNKEILQKIEHAGAVDRIRRFQVGLVNIVLDPQRIARMIEIEALPNTQTYTAVQMLDDLRKGIWSEIYNNQVIGTTRRNLQRGYLERMDYLMDNELSPIPPQFINFYGWTDVDVSQSDIRPMVREQLELLKTDIEDVLPTISARKTKLHLQDVITRIDDILNPKK